MIGSNGQHEKCAFATAASALNHRRRRCRLQHPPQPHPTHHSRDTRPYGKPKLNKKKKKKAAKKGVGGQGGEGGEGRSGAAEGEGEGEGEGEDGGESEEEDDVAADELSTDAVEESQDSQNMQVLVQFISSLAE